jgi:small nuclear ribonucleoprotein (snRNP)-like protein
MKTMTILSTALFLLAPAPALAGEPPPRAASAPDVSSATRSKLQNRVVVVEKRDGSLVTGKLVGGDDSSVELQAGDGRRVVVEISTIKALRQKLHGYQVTVTMKGKDETISGKLLERDSTTIVVETDDGARVVLDRASIESVYERVPDGAAAGAGDAAPPTPAPAETPPPEPPPAGQKLDAVRLRAGLGAGGGFAFVSSSAGSAVAPMVGFSGHIGVQVNHFFSVYYQNTGALPIASGATSFFDYNSLLLDLTLGHVFDIGAGPSADVMMVSAGNASVTAVLPGMHARLALTLGGASGPGPRRSGFSVGLELHPTFGPGGVIFAMSPLVGYEWF